MGLKVRVVVVAGFVCVVASACTPIGGARSASTAGSGGTGSPAAVAGSVPAPTVSSVALAQQTSVAKYGVHVDVVEPDHTLRTVDGHVYQFGPGDLGDVVRVPSGWLYGPSGHERQLLRSDGTTVTLAGAQTNSGTFEQPPDPVVNADGTRMAWVSGIVLHAATITPDGLRNVVDSPAPAHAFAATWIGTRVVVGQTYATDCCGYDRAQFDVWDPTRGAFVPHWTKEVASVYGPVPAGTTAYANVQGATTTAGCLAPVDGVSGMSVTGRVCLPGLSFRSLINLIAPDGRHLVELESPGTRLMVIDLAAARAPVKAPFGCAADRPLVWEDARTVLVRRSDALNGPLLRCDITTGTTRPVGIVAATLVPRFGV